MILFSRRVALAAMLALALAACSPSSPETRPVTVFAAASLTDALEDVAAAYRAATGATVRLSFAGSGAVARQVEAGAPVDLVILADGAWMDRLASAGRIQADTRNDLLGNSLVVIAPADARIGDDPIEAMLRTQGRLAIGDPESVPAGAYAREWLKRTGRWDDLQPRLVTAADVRAVRAFVARGEVALGVVYRSDAVGIDAVRIVEEPSAIDRPDIVYPVALTVDAGVGATDFLRFLRSRTAAAIFRRHGFEPR